jgi:lactoylglutathione lyase
MAEQDFDPRCWIAGTDADRPRMLHTMMRVRDPQASIRFYVEGLGMKLVDVFEIPERRLTAHFLGFEEGQQDGFLELAWYWDAEAAYTHGSGYGHVSVGAPDFDATFARLKAFGAEVLAEPFRIFPGGPRLAMVKDPDGYAVEIVQARRAQAEERA